MRQVVMVMVAAASLALSLPLGEEPANATLHSDGPR